ncbi:hypothetical protein CUMW_207170, partial [Citrus unshiu]
ININTRWRKLAAKVSHDGGSFCAFLNAAASSSKHRDGAGTGSFIGHRSSLFSAGFRCCYCIFAVCFSSRSPEALSRLVMEENHCYY